MTRCRPGSHRCAALALWFLDNALALRIAADCERKMGNIHNPDATQELQEDA